MYEESTKRRVRGAARTLLYGTLFGACAMPDTSLAPESSVSEVTEVTSAALTAEDARSAQASATSTTTIQGTVVLADLIDRVTPALGPAAGALRSALQQLSKAETRQELNAALSKASNELTMLTSKVPENARVELDIVRLSLDALRS